MASRKNYNASTASISSLHKEETLNATSFPTTLPTPSGPLSPIASGAPDFPEPRRRGPIARTLARSDETAARLTKLLSTPSGIDTTLATAYYTLKFLKASTDSLLEVELESIASKFLRNASDALLPGETVIASFPAPKLASILAQTSVSSKALADIISDYRTFMRLWGLLGIYAWGKSVYLDPPTDRTLKRVAYAQVAVNTVYQIYENLAYLGSHGVIRRAEARIGQDWLVSSRCWAIHIALDLVRLYRTRVLWDREAEEVAEKGGEINVRELRAKRRTEIERWWKALASNVCYAPMAVHYSVPGGFLSDGACGALGIMAAGAGFRQLWASTKTA